MALLLALFTQSKHPITMFRRLLLVFTDADLRKKMLYIVLLLVAARLLAHIPIPVLRTQDISLLVDNDAVLVC